MNARDVTAAASAPVHAAAPGIVLMARVGYAAKGIVYLVIGWLAAHAALGRGGATTDSRGALRVVGDGPAGSAALLAIGLGLLGYMAWRLISAATDAERRGSEPSSVALRLSQAVRGLAYGALGVQALRELAGRGSSGGGGGGGQARHWTARIMEMHYGRALVMLVGIGVIAYACYQLYRSRTDAVRKHLNLAEAGPNGAGWVVQLGRFGIAARAVVFAMIGVLLVRAAREHDSSQAGGIAEGLRALAEAPYGRMLLAAVAIGLMAYGLYQVATARYRRMQAV